MFISINMYFIVILGHGVLLSFIDSTHVLMEGSSTEAL